MPTREELAAMGFSVDSTTTYKAKVTGVRKANHDIPLAISKTKKKQEIVKIPKGTDYGLPWEVKGGSFMCKFRKQAFTDEECMLWCKSEECKFHEKGYFRTTEIGQKKAVLK